MSRILDSIITRAQESARVNRQKSLAARAEREASRGSASEASAGLVPYTTSRTTPTALQVSNMVWVSGAAARLARMKHHVRTAGRLVKETMRRSGSKWRAVFVTLTYRPGVEWSPSHMTNFAACVRVWGERQGVKVGYLWVAEMQKRGAVHYHAVIWIPSRLQLPRPDRRGWWKHGSSNVQSVKRNAVGYLMKYVSKGAGDAPDFPKGLRICGSGGLDAMARDEFHYWRLPRYVRDAVSIGERCTRAPGGGWVSRVSGQVWRSAFGLFVLARCGMGKDGEGRERRKDVMVILSDEYARQSGGVQRDPALVDAWREAVYDEGRALMAGLAAEWEAERLQWGVEGLDWGADVY